MKQPISNLLFVSTVFIILILLFTPACKQKIDTLPFVRPVKVDVVEATTIANVMLLEGNVEADRVVDVPPYRQGIVKDIRVEVNDRVRKNDILFTIDQSTMTGANFEPTPIFSPIDGMISDIHVKPGTTVGATSSLGTVIQQETMKIVCDIPAEKIFQLKARLDEARAQKHKLLCWIKVPAHKNRLIGWVEKIYPADQKATRTSKVEIRYDNKSGLLRHNMFARVEVFMGETYAILIPKDAVIAEQMLRYVMIYQPVTMKDQEMIEKHETEHFGKVRKQVVQVNENQSIVRIKGKTLEVLGDKIPITYVMDDKVQLMNQPVSEVFDDSSQRTTPSDVQPTQLEQRIQEDVERDALIQQEKPTQVQLIRGLEEGNLIIVESQKWVANNEVVVLTERTKKITELIQLYTNKEEVSLLHKEEETLP